MSEIFYSVGHIWFEVERNIVKVGITDHLKNRITLNFIQMSDIGNVIDSGCPIGVFESKKSIYEIITPFACKIIERNEKLMACPDCIYQQNERANWLYIAEICDDNWGEKLMDYEEYQSYIEP